MHYWGQFEAPGIVAKDPVLSCECVAKNASFKAPLSSFSTTCISFLELKLRWCLHCTVSVVTTAKLWLKNIQTAPK